MNILLRLALARAAFDYSRSFLFRYTKRPDTKWYLVFLVHRKGLDLHFASRREAKLWCQLRQAEVEPQSTGLWHVDGFESFLPA